MPLQVYQPLPPLAPLLMHILALEFDFRESRLPATLCPALVLFVRGGVDVVAADGRRTRAPRFGLSGAHMTPRHSFADPGTVSLSVLFRPGMLQPALGLSAAALTARSVPLAELCGRERVALLLAAMDEERPLSDHVRLFQQFLLTVLRPRAGSGLGEAFVAAQHKIFFPVLDIARYFGIGERQLERRIQQAFGLPLRDVRRLIRLGLTLQRFLGRPVARGELARIAQEAGFYDQAHMHRELVEMLGLSPAALLEKIAGDDPAYWLYRIAPADYRRLFPAVG